MFKQADNVRFRNCWEKGSQMSNFAPIAAAAAIIIVATAAKAETDPYLTFTGDQGGKIEYMDSANAIWTTPEGKVYNVTFSETSIAGCMAANDVDDNTLNIFCTFTAGQSIAAIFIDTEVYNRVQ